MRILHLTPYYKPAYAFGGVVRAVEGMATTLAARGHQVTVLTSDALNQSSAYQGARDEAIDGVRVFRWANRSTWLRGKLNLSTPRGLRGAAKSLLPGADILHLHEFRTAENLLASPIAHELRVPMALSPHGTLNLSTGRGGLKRAWDRWLSPPMARRIDHVICLSDSEANESRSLWSGFGSAPACSVIPNGVRVADFNELPKPESFRQRHGLSDAPTALFLGRLHKRKGPDLLLRAFLRAGLERAQLIFAGPDDGMRSTLEAQAAHDRRVVFTGYLDGAERLAALAAADVFVLPAVGEGLPMAALEAMAAGLPVLLSPGCNMPEVASEGAGLVVDAAVDPLADALRRLLLDAELRTRMGVAARKLAEDRYAWETLAARLEAVYAGLLHNRRA